MGSLSGPVLRLHRPINSSRQLGAVYPWHFGSALQVPGPTLGTDVMSGRLPFSFDPFAAVRAGICNNPNGLVIGAPASGKSTWGKSLAYWLCGIGGHRLVAIDVKSEYAALAAALDIPTLSLYPGGTARVNVFDGRTDSDSIQRTQDFACAVSAVAMNRPLDVSESAVLSRVIATVIARTRAPATSTASRAVLPTLVDVLDLLMTPTGELLSGLRLAEDRFHSITQELRFSVQELVGDGKLAGMLDTATTVDSAALGRGVIIDISRATSDQVLRLAVLAALRVIDEIVADPHPTIMLNDEVWRMCGTLDTMRYLQASWKLGRQRGMSNWGLAHRLADLAGQADDGTATSKIGSALAGDSDTFVLFRQGKQADAEAAIVQSGLPEAMTQALLKLPQGRCVVTTPKAFWVVQLAIRFSRLGTITFTDQNMAAWTERALG